jgi:hypothetical protein
MNSLEHQNLSHNLVIHKKSYQFMSLKTELILFVFVNNKAFQIFQTFLKSNGYFPKYSIKRVTRFEMDHTLSI